MSSFCNPDKITISPDRFRLVTVDDPDVKGIADSIKEIGQLQAILVDDNLGLIDGLNRLMACKRLERDVFYITESEAKLVLDNPLLRKVAEHQANFRRRDFSQAQTAFAITEIHNLMVEVYGEARTGPGAAEAWSQADTAKKLGYKSHATVSSALVVAKAIEHNVQGVAEAKTASEALSIVKKAARIEAAGERARRLSESQSETAEIPDPIAYFGERIVLGDCLEKMKGLSNGICNLFITDPPWQIKMDKVISDSGSADQKASGTYDDSSDTIIPLIKAVIDQMARVGKPDCYVVMFCGAKHWTTLTDHFRSVGFQVYNKPLVWVKTGPVDGLCSSKSPAPSMWPASTTDFMILARRGNPVLAQLHKGDAFLCPPIRSADRIHQAQKPPRLMEEIISRFYHPATNPLLIDPFVGSGATLVAARRVGIKQYFGYELDPGNRQRAVEHLVNCYMKEISGEDASVTTVDLEDYE